MTFEDWLSREDWGDVEQLRRAWEGGAREERRLLTTEFADIIGREEVGVYTCQHCQHQGKVKAGDGSPLVVNCGGCGRALGLVPSS